MYNHNLDTAMSWMVNGTWVKVKGNLGKCLVYRAAQHQNSPYGNPDEILVSFSDGKTEWHHIDNVEKLPFEEWPIPATSCVIQGGNYPDMPFDKVGA